MFRPRYPSGFLLRLKLFLIHLDFRNVLNHIRRMSQAPYENIVIAGPTASGKSALAVALAERFGGAVVNADALQVYDCWRILTARPDDADLARAPHHLYGHIPADATYSVGHWLREVAEVPRPEGPLIFTGGTGLYLSALTRGLAEIPPIPPTIRAEGDRLRAGGLEAFRTYLATHDPVLYQRVDRANGMRLQRAWEVHRTTGTALSDWQRNQPKALIPNDTTLHVVLFFDPSVLAERIALRFRRMVQAGVLDEVAAQRSGWDPTLPSSRALGAAPLLEHLEGRLTLQEAEEQAVVSSRQYAKRQRTWFRSNMPDWIRINGDREPIQDVMKVMIN